MNKGFSLLEIMISIFILGILVALAVPMYDDYTKKSRAAELPYLIKTIVEVQITRKANPETGSSYATALESMSWGTSSGKDVGKFYSFGTSGVDDCDPGTAADPLPVGLGEAWAKDNDSVPLNWRSGCMDSEHVLRTNSF